MEDWNLLPEPNYNLHIGKGKIDEDIWVCYQLYQFQLSIQNCGIQSYQSRDYSSSMNHLLCDRLCVIVHSQQFSESQ